MKHPDWFTEAEKRIAEMDAVDRSTGFATPFEAPAPELFRTAVAAFEAGVARMEANDNRTAQHCFAEAFVMALRCV